MPLIREGSRLSGSGVLVNRACQRFRAEQVQHAGLVLGPEGRIVYFCRFAGKNDPGYCGQLALPRTLLAVTGACVAIRRAVYCRRKPWHYIVEEVSNLNRYFSPVNDAFIQTTQ